MSLIVALALSLSQAQNPTPPDQTQGPVSAFPGGPKAPPPRVKDLTVPPAPAVTGGITPVPPGVLNAPLTADEAARIALQLQPSLLNQLGAIHQQQGRTRQIGAAQNPQLIGGAGINKNSSISGPWPGLEAPNGTTPLGASPVYTFAGALSLRQLLYDFNQTRSLVRQSRALEDVAKANLTTAQQDLVLDVKTAFYNLTNANRTVQVDQDNIANRQRQLDLANARLASGLGQPSDVVTAQTTKSQAILALNVARDEAQQDRVQLLQLMGVDPLTPIVVTDESAPAPVQSDPKELTRTAIRLRPEVRVAEQELLAAKYGLSAAKSLNLPSIYAELAAGVAGANFPLDNNSVAVGVGLQFPIIDGGQRAGAIQSAHGVIESAESDLKSAIQGVQRDVASAYLALQSAEQRVSIAGNEVFNAQEGVRVAEGRYTAGVGLFLDITTAQGLLLNAQTDQTTAQNSLDLARTQLRRATGELMPEISPSVLKR